MELAPINAIYLPHIRRLLDAAFNPDTRNLPRDVIEYIIEPMMQTGSILSCFEGNKNDIIIPWGVFGTKTVSPHNHNTDVVVIYKKVHPFGSPPDTDKPILTTLKYANIKMEFTTDGIIISGDQQCENGMRTIYVFGIDEDDNICLLQMYAHPINKEKFCIGNESLYWSIADNGLMRKQNDIFKMIPETIWKKTYLQTNGYICVDLDSCSLEFYNLKDILIGVIRFDDIDLSKIELIIGDLNHWAFDLKLTNRIYYGNQHIYSYIDVISGEKMLSVDYVQIKKLLKTYLVVFR